MLFFKKKMKRFSIQDINEYYFSYLYISVFLGCFLCGKSEKNENFDLPYEHKLPNSLLLSQNKTHDLLSK